MPRTGKPQPEKVLKCDQCDYTTPRKAFMQDHARIHTGERPYRCDTCGKGFTQKSNLTKHLIVHGDGYRTTFKCDRCDFTTMYKQSLKMHLNWHNGVKPYKCTLCEREFSQSTHRRTHMKEAHGDERRYQCHLCSKCFKRKEHLDKHIVFHSNERNFECDICQKKFFEAKHVTIHMLVHSGEETKVHQCDLCDYKSRYKQGLEVHYRIHLGLRPYQCSECPKAFRTSQTLKIHSRMVHQGMMGKIFNCSECDYSSANKQTLKQHIDHIHMGVKTKQIKASCEYCGRTYSTKSSLHGHKRKKHPMKLRQEMQLRIQKRLVDVKRVGDNAPPGIAGTVDDYRYRSSLHAAVARAMEKARRKSIRTCPRLPTPIKKLISPKKEIISPQKSPKKEVITPKKSPLKINVRDLFQRGQGSRFISRKNLAKELELNQNECLEKNRQANSVELGEVSNKLSYMSTLGLLHMSPSSNSHQKDVQINSSHDENQFAANLEMNSLQNSGNIAETNQGEVGKHSELEQNSGKFRPAKRKAKATRKKTKVHKTITCDKFDDVSISQVFDLPDLPATNVALKQSPKSPKRQRSPSVGSPKPNSTNSKISETPQKTPSKGKRGKSITQIADTLAAKRFKPQEENDSQPVIEYEPLAVPSLGPREESFEPLDLSIQTLGSVTSAIPGFNGTTEADTSVGICVQTPLVSTMATFDSLRDLACEFMTN